MNPEDYEFIDESEIESVKRGRKTAVPADVIDLMKKIPKGKGLLLKKYALDTSDLETYKKGKAKLSAMFRKAGKFAGVHVTTTWSPSGIPQVTVLPLSGKSK